MSDILQPDASNKSLTPAASDNLSHDVSAVIQAYLDEREVTDSVANTEWCDANQGAHPIMNRLLGTNQQAMILSCKADGTCDSLLWWDGLRFPKDMSIWGRNILVSHYWDGSIRIETVDAMNKWPDDGYSGNSTRLEKSELTLTYHGKIYNNLIVILDGKWGMITAKK